MSKDPATTDQHKIIIVAGRCKALKNTNRHQAAMGRIHVSPSSNRLMVRALLFGICTGHWDCWAAHGVGVTWVLGLSLMLA